MKKSHIKATALRTAMIITIFVIIGISATGFYYFTQSLLSKFAIKVSSNSINVNISKSTTNSNNVNKANSVIASSQSYKNQVTQDLNKYASSTGVSITNLSFTQPTISSTEPSITGVESKFATITLKSPVVFTNLMQFLKAIENNLPKIQLTGISLGRATGSNDSVTVEPLTIEVFTR
jgi:hypothetical protein